MLDVYNLGRAQSAQFQVFYAAQSAVTTDGWQRWIKPRGAAMTYMFMQPSGGSGGGGVSGVGTTAGGGGGAGGATRLIIPAAFVPDVLYIRPGRGGAAVGAATAGNAGVQSYVAVQPNITSANLVLTQPGGGGGASATTAGAAGASGAATVFSSLGFWVSSAGQAGGTGAAAANGAGTLVTPGGSGIVTSGGAGGGNGTGAGGQINGPLGYWPFVSGGLGTTGGAGAAGFNLNKRLLFELNSFAFPHLIFSGGSGGGGVNTAAVAGAGGAAAYGSGGGGGGGSSLAGGTGGAGGAGGDGFVIIGAM